MVVSDWRSWILGILDYSPLETMKDGPGAHRGIVLVVVPCMPWHPPVSVPFPTLSPAWLPLVVCVLGDAVWPLFAYSRLSYVGLLLTLPCNVNLFLTSSRFVHSFIAPQSMAEVVKTNRKCTDLLFLVLFVTFNLVLLWVTYHAFVRGNVARLTRGMDSDGNICGLAGQPHQPTSRRLHAPGVSDFGSTWKSRRFIWFPVKPKVVSHFLR